MNVLSLFDGMSCGQIALNKLGIKYEKYFASEIKTHAIQVTQHNYPNTIQLGDITKINGGDLPKIDLLFGGSPCQDLSRANSIREGLDGSKSGLFYQFLRV
jgi:site-specific DNA-cytosine methylase